MYLYDIDLFEKKYKNNFDESNRVPNYLINEYIDHIKYLEGMTTKMKKDFVNEYDDMNKLLKNSESLFKYSNIIHDGYKTIHQFIYKKINKPEELQPKDFPLLKKIEDLLIRLKEKEGKRYQKFSKIKENLFKDNKLKILKENFKNIENNLIQLEEMLGSKKLNEYLSNSKKLLEIVDKVNFEKIYKRGKSNISKAVSKINKSMVQSYIVIGVVFFIVIILSVNIIKKIKQSNIIL